MDTLDCSGKAPYMWRINSRPGVIHNEKTAKNFWGKTVNCHGRAQKKKFDSRDLLSPWNKPGHVLQVARSISLKRKGEPYKLED